LSRKRLCKLIQYEFKYWVVSDFFYEFWAVRILCVSGFKFKIENYTPIKEFHHSIKYYNTILNKYKFRFYNHFLLEVNKSDKKCMNETHVEMLKKLPRVKLL